MTVEAVVFDIDGTLIDTNAAHIQAWREAFRMHNHNVPARRIQPEVGKGGDQLVPAILGPEVEKRDGKAIRKDHDNAYKRIAEQEHFAVFPGVKELFAALKERGLRTALATSSSQEQIDLVEKSSGLEVRKLADLVVTSDDADATKPAPDIVLAALGKLKLPPECCIFVGDTVHDVQAARLAGVPCLAVLCGGCFTEKALLAAGARSVWRDPADILEHLDKALASGKS